MLGDPNANAFVGGAALTTDFIKNRPDVARRFTLAWGKAVDLINNNPAEARKHLVKNTFTPDDVVDTVPMIRYFMAKDLTAKDKADYQKFIDFSVKAGTLGEAGRRHQVSQGVLTCHGRRCGADCEPEGRRAVAARPPLRRPRRMSPFAA